VDARDGGEKGCEKEKKEEAKVARRTE